MVEDRDEGEWLALFRFMSEVMIVKERNKHWKTMINGLNGIVNGQSGTERDRNRESEILQAADRHTD